MRWTGREVGSLVIRDGKVLALPSRDISDTFVYRALGLDAPNAEREAMERALMRREVRNTEAPAVWSGPDADARPPRKESVNAYTPEGF